MRHRRFTTRLLNTPHLIEPAAAASVVRMLIPNARIRAYSEDDFGGPADPVQRDPREYSVMASTAIIPVVGELVNRGGWMEAQSQVLSYMDLQDMIADALADRSIDSLLLDIDSPGGEAAGVLDFALWLAAQRGQKPIIAHVNQMACSAAYAIASGADWIGMGADALAGSIGVVAYHADLSAQLAEDGVAIEYVYAGDRKIDGNPAEPLSDPARLALQGMVDRLYDRFCSVVAQNRGLSVTAVRATEAAIFNGPDAVAAGLADLVLTQEDTLMTIATRRAPAGTRMLRPNATANPAQIRASTDPAVPADPVLPADPAVPAPEPQLPARHELEDLTVEEAEELAVRNAPASPAASALAIANACTKAGHPDMIAGLLARGASLVDVRRAIENADAIKAACIAGGRPSMAASLVRSGVSLDHAREMIFASKADADGAIQTDSGHQGIQAAPAAKPVGTTQAAPVYAAYNKALGSPR